MNVSQLNENENENESSEISITSTSSTSMSIGMITESKSKSESSQSKQDKSNNRRVKIVENKEGGKRSLVSVLKDAGLASDVASKYLQLFQREEIDVEALELMQAEDFAVLKVPMGHKLKILRSLHNT